MGLDHLDLTLSFPLGINFLLDGWNGKAYMWIRNLRSEGTSPLPRRGKSSIVVKLMVQLGA